MSIDQRCTGRTTRQIIGACTAMMMGKRVLFVCKSYDHARDCAKEARAWVEKNIVPHYRPGLPEVVCQEARIEFGSGLLVFTGTSMHTSGLGITTIVEDHSIADARALRAKHRARNAACHKIVELMRIHGFTTARQLNVVHDSSTAIEFI